MSRSLLTRGLGAAVLVFALVPTGAAPVVALATRADNPEVIAARRSMLRGTIFDASGQMPKSRFPVTLIMPPPLRGKP